MPVLRALAAMVGVIGMLCAVFAFVLLAVLAHAVWWVFNLPARVIGGRR